MAEQITIRNGKFFGGPRDGDQEQPFKILPGKPYVADGVSYRIRRTKDGRGQNVTLLVHPDAVAIFEED